MLGLLYRLIVGSFHRHRWVVHERAIVSYKSTGGLVDTDSRGACYIQRCTGCGKMRTWRALP